MLTVSVSVVDMTPQHYDNSTLQCMLQHFCIIIKYVSILTNNYRHVHKQLVTQREMNCKIMQKIKQNKRINHNQWFTLIDLHFKYLSTDVSNIIDALHFFISISDTHVWGCFCSPAPRLQVSGSVSCGKTPKSHFGPFSVSKVSATVPDQLRGDPRAPRVLQAFPACHLASKHLQGPSLKHLHIGQMCLFLLLSPWFDRMTRPGPPSASTRKTHRRG